MISQKEYEVLKGLDDKWKWIARDFGYHGGSLAVYLEKPFKCYDVRGWDFDCSIGIRYIDNQLFQFIQWGDEEPYSITELMEEYEKEREETEIKDINPLMKYVNREIETIKDILSHMDREESEGGNEWLEGFLSALEKVRDKLNKLDEPEVLSQELPVIPQWVANNIESKKRAGVRLNVAMSDFPEFKLEKELDIDEYECNEIYARAWLDGYTVEEEQKYIVKLPLPGDETNDFAVVDIYGYIWTDDEWPSRCKMTEKEIKALPKGEAYFEHFAVKVEEME